jgi:hypothetical protein
MKTKNRKEQRKKDRDPSFPFIRMVVGAVYSQSQFTHDLSTRATMTRRKGAPAFASRCIFDQVESKTHTGLRTCAILLLRG